MRRPDHRQRVKASEVHVGDFVYCRSKYYRDQLQLAEVVGLVIEIKRSNFKLTTNDAGFPARRSPAFARNSWTIRGSLKNFTTLLKGSTRRSANSCQTVEHID